MSVANSCWAIWTWIVVSAEWETVISTVCIARVSSCFLFASKWLRSLVIISPKMSHELTSSTPNTVTWNRSSTACWRGLSHIYLHSTIVFDIVSIRGVVTTSINNHCRMIFNSYPRIFRTTTFPGFPCSWLCRTIFTRPYNSSWTRIKTSTHWVFRRYQPYWSITTNEKKLVVCQMRKLYWPIASVVICGSIHTCAG